MDPTEAHKLAQQLFQHLIGMNAASAEFPVKSTNAVGTVTVTVTARVEPIKVGEKP